MRTQDNTIKREFLVMVRLIEMPFASARRPGRIGRVHHVPVPENPGRAGA